LRCVDVVVGTQDEINAVMMADPDQVSVTYSQVSDARVSGDTGSHIRSILEMGPKVVVEKRGRFGCRVHGSDGTTEDVPGFAIEIKNILGAGDAFGAGFIYGLVKGWDIVEAARFGNACGAIVVTRHGCSASMPTFEEVEQFIDRQAKP
jgi:5-dehydro-2-deoxygluconokinase